MPPVWVVRGVYLFWAEGFAAGGSTEGLGLVQPTTVICFDTCRVLVGVNSCMCATGSNVCNHSFPFALGNVSLQPSCACAPWPEGQGAPALRQLVLFEQVLSSQPKNGQ